MAGVTFSLDEDPVGPAIGERDPCRPFIQSDCGSDVFFFLEGVVKNHELTGPPFFPGTDFWNAKEHPVLPVTAANIQLRHAKHSPHGLILLQEKVGLQVDTLFAGGDVPGLPCEIRMEFVPTDVGIDLLKIGPAKVNIGRPVLAGIDALFARDVLVRQARLVTAPESLKHVIKSV